MVFGEQPLFVVRSIRNTQVHSVGRTQSFIMLNQVVQIVTTWICRVKLTTYAISGRLM
jgi:hypothetical protein